MFDDPLASLAPWLVFVGGCATGFALLRLGYRRLRSGVPSSGGARAVPDKDALMHEIPLRSAHTGLRGLPWLAVSSNNLSPRLAVTPEGIAYRVLRSRRRAFAEIEHVELRRFGATVHLVFQFRSSPFLFVGHVGDLATARRALTRLNGRVPLAATAADLLASPPEA